MEIHATRHLHSAAETERFGMAIGQRLRGGETIELVSDVGGGKTTFVRGLARGAGSDDVVASPSFTISKCYSADQFTIYHFDMYRLDDPGLMRHELSDVLGDKACVVVVEWPDIVQDVLPLERLQIRFIPIGENERTAEVQAPDSLSYLLDDQS